MIQGEKKCDLTGHISMVKDERMGLQNFALDSSGQMRER